MCKRQTTIDHVNSRLDKEYKSKMQDMKKLEQPGGYQEWSEAEKNERSVPEEEPVDEQKSEVESEEAEEEVKPK